MSGVSIPIPYMQASGAGIAWGTSAGGCRSRSRRVCPIWLICSLTSCRRVSDPPAPSARRWNSSAQTARTGEGTWHPPQTRRHAGGRPAPTPQPHRLRTLARHNNSSPAGSGEVTTGGSRLKLRSQVRRPWWKVVRRSWGGRAARSTARRMVLRPERRYQARRLWRPAARKGSRDRNASAAWRLPALEADRK